MMKFKNKKLSNETFNALTRYTHLLKVDGCFDIVEKGDIDCGYNYDTRKYVTLYSVLKWLKEAIVYSPAHDGLTMEEAELIGNIFKEANLVNDEWITMWINS